MAILYGTQSNGETLPVQVNETGQLVARGLQGEKGDKGDDGEKGEKGDPGDPGQNGGLQISTGTWTPGFAVMDDNGTFSVDYKSQEGTFTQVGSWWVGRFHIATFGASYSLPEMPFFITGFPTLVWTNRGDYSASLLNEASNFQEPLSTVVLQASGDLILPKYIVDEETGASAPATCSLLTPNEGNGANVNRILGQLSGMIATPEQAAAQKEFARSLYEGVMTTDID
jgi:hypothetical protein